MICPVGRIEIVDGRWRYEVAKNWLDRGEPLIADRVLLAIGEQQFNGKTGKSYSSYNAAPSIAACHRPKRAVSLCRAAS